MLSFPDLALLSGLALIIFGPERLPSIARQVGQAVGTVRGTANAFVREMERVSDVPAPLTPRPPVAGPLSTDTAPAAPPLETAPLAANSAEHRHASDALRIDVE